MRAQEPDLWDAELEAQIVTMLREAVDCEVQFAEDLLAGGVAGLSLRDMRTVSRVRCGLAAAAARESRRRFTRRIRSRLWTFSDVQELTNFFERRVSAYQTAVEGEVGFGEGLLSELAAFDVQCDVVESVAGSESRAAVFKKGETDKVRAGDGERGFTSRRNPHNASLAMERGGDIKIIVDIERHALCTPETVIEDGGSSIRCDGVNGLIRTGGGAGDEERSSAVESKMIGRHAWLQCGKDEEITGIGQAGCGGDLEDGARSVPDIKISGLVEGDAGSDSKTFGKEGGVAGRADAVDGPVRARTGVEEALPIECKPSRIQQVADEGADLEIAVDREDRNRNLLAPGPGEGGEEAAISVDGGVCNGVQVLGHWDGDAGMKRIAC